VALERTEIERALRQADYNVGKAAKALGASRRTLQNRMREYGMARGKAGRRKRLLPYGRKVRYGAALGLGAAALVGGALLWRRRGSPA
jgi:AraC-like DNA-binding protein